MVMKVEKNVLQTTLHLVQIILAAEQIRDPELKAVIMASLIKEAREFTTGYKTPINKKQK